jgi:hypothetical protein
MGVFVSFLCCPRSPTDCAYDQKAESNRYEQGGRRDIDDDDDDDDDLGKVFSSYYWITDM